MANLTKRIHEKDQKIATLEAELANMRRVVGWIDPSYAAALVDLADVATLDLRRPDDLGGPVTTNGAASRPPAYSWRAYRKLVNHRAWQRKEAVRLRQYLRQLVDGDEGPDNDPADRAGRQDYNFRVRETA